MSPFFNLELVSKLLNLEVLEIAGVWMVAGPRNDPGFTDYWAQRPRIQLPRLKTVIFFQASTKILQIVVQKLDSPILSTLVLHNYSHPPSSNLAREKRELPELKLSNGRIIPVIRIQSAWIHELPPIVQKIPSYAQHKLDLCVLAPRQRYEFFTIISLVELKGESPAKRQRSPGIG
ncbi:hypothetical protein M407DRAFT_21078 [Tulasnella calospora MUT 4182]|uniref:Uncharacterized protein n=1 Tax=Tulasnella calospora MUT 4182 TaxID=1051891 RepID=A0A0C3QNW3_9AGAM|nr:hypothetical protein M407DRAFT_21078 [Tulasnella calospora MUT 4182]